MVVKYAYLVVDIIVIILQLTVIICNGFMFFLFISERSLRRGSSRQLVLFLVTADFINALALLPYTVFLLYSWNPLCLDLNPYYVMFGSTPLIVQLKINLTLTISIAVERTLALFFPVVFRRLSFHSYAVVCLLFGILLGALDLILEFSLSPIRSSPNCSAIGCFLSDDFRHYWGISNMVMGIIVIVLVSLVLNKLRAVMQHRVSLRVLVTSRENKFKQANRSCIGILLTSLIFVTLPSVGAGVVEMLGFSVFKALGPFYIVGIFGAGTCNSVVYFTINKDIQKLATTYVFGTRSPKTTTTSGTESNNMRIRCQILCKNKWTRIELSTADHRRSSSTTNVFMFQPRAAANTSQGANVKDFQRYREK